MKEKISVATGVLVFNKLGEIFLAKSSGKWGNNWCVPGGHLEYGESIGDCVRREVLEETNIEIQDIRFVSVAENIFPPHRPEKHFIFLNYRAVAKEDGLIKLNDEHLEYIWIKPELALDSLNLYKSTRSFISEVL